MCGGIERGVSLLEPEDIPAAGTALLSHHLSHTLGLEWVCGRDESGFVSDLCPSTCHMYKNIEQSDSPSSGTLLWRQGLAAFPRLSLNLQPFRLSLPSS